LAARKYNINICILGYLNDLWKYNVSINEWTWVSGSVTPNQIGQYIRSPADTPVTVETPLSSDAPLSSGSTPSKEVDDPSNLRVIIPSVVVPVVAVTVTLLVVLLLRKRFRKRRDSNNSMTIFSPVDARLISHNDITLNKEIGVGSYGKGTIIISSLHNIDCVVSTPLFLVYVGKYRTTKVAVKVANCNIPQEEFLQEARFQLDIPPHPNIVQLLGVSVDGPQPLVVLEYCNEGSLDRLFDSDEPLSHSLQFKLAAAIARGLHHLHENNIVHRDLAARNVLMHNAEPKISDIGMSRKLKEASQVGKTASNIGPIRWMAPESLCDQSYSTKSDVWTFGVVLYEITARQEPHITESLLTVGTKIRDEGFTPLIPEDCPPLLQEIMQMCWRKNPTDRPVS
jgi:phosphate/sulfate permease